MRRRSVPLLLALVVAIAPALPAAARRTPHIVRVPGTRAPAFVSGLSTASHDGAPVAVSLNHLAANGARYGIARPERSLSVSSVTRRRDLVDVRFAQEYSGVPVWGAEYIVHLRSTDDGYSTEAVNGRFFTDLDPPVAPAFGASVARDLARMRSRVLTDLRLLPHGLTVLPRDEGVLTYHFTALGSVMGRPVAYEMFLNALTGTVELAFNNYQSDGPVSATGTTSHGHEVSFGAYESGSIVELRDQSKPMFATSGGEITTHNVKRARDYLARPNNITTSPTTHFSGGATSSGAVDAHYGASLVYDFFKNLGRDSLDGAGMDIVSSVNALERDGLPMYNAFWDGINKQMVYGNPDPANYHPFSASLDVVGHELTHGVTQFSGNLAYIGQSGAMNEAYSDYFGNAIEVTASGESMTAPEVGYLGEDLCKTSRDDVIPCPLRDLNDGTTTEDYIYFLADLDNGGVHLNSTIFGGALWDVREALGADADRYIYRALTAYTTPLDDFVAGRNAVINAARDLGASEEQIDQIEAAFDAHGIVEGWDTAASNDANVLMSDVAPVSDLGFSPPQLSGRRFAIADYEDKAQMCCVGLQIFSGSLAGGDVEKVSVPVATSRSTDETPDISGTRVVWSRHRIGDGRVTGSRIVTRSGGGGETTVARGASLINPSIDGRLVAWESWNANSDIHARYLGKRVRVLDRGRGDQMFPQVNGDWVAWWDARGQPRIRLENLATGRTRTVRARDDFTFIGLPSLNDRYVFWFELGSFDIRGSIVRMDLRTGKRKVLVRPTSEYAPVWALALTAPPVVSANADHFVYSSELEYAQELGAFGRPGSVPNDEVGRDIFMGSLDGGTIVPVTSNRADQAFPMIGSGRQVLWLDSSGGQTDLVTRAVP